VAQLNEMSDLDERREREPVFVWLRATHYQHARCHFLYLLIYLSEYAFSTFVKYDVTCHARIEETKSMQDMTRLFWGLF